MQYNPSSLKTMLGPEAFLYFQDSYAKIWEKEKECLSLSTKKDCPYSENSLPEKLEALYNTKMTFFVELAEHMTRATSIRPMTLQAENPQDLADLLDDTRVMAKRLSQMSKDMEDCKCESRPDAMTLSLFGKTIEILLDEGSSKKTTWLLPCRNHDGLYLS